MGRLQRARRGAAAVSLAGKIYVVGGWNDEFLSSVECYDPASNEWTSVAPLNIARAGHQCCVVDDSIYAIGGRQSIYGELPAIEIEKYDQRSNKWTIVSYTLSLRIPKH